VRDDADGVALVMGECYHSGSIETIKAVYETHRRAALDSYGGFGRACSRSCSKVCLAPDAPAEAGERERRIKIVSTCKIPTTNRQPFDPPPM